MSTTIDDLIALKDFAVEFAYSVVGNHDVPEGVRESARCVIQDAELYDAAEGCDDVSSVEQYEERSADERRAEAGIMTDYAYENAQCPECGNYVDDNGDNYMEVSGEPYGRPDLTDVAAHRTCIGDSMR